MPPQKGQLGYRSPPPRAKTPTRPPARPPSRPPSRPSPGGGRAGSPQGPVYRTGVREKADLTHAKYGNARGGVEGRDTGRAKRPEAPETRAPSGAGYRTPAPPGANAPARSGLAGRERAGSNVPDYVIRRQVVAPPGAPPVDETQQGPNANALYNFALQATPLPFLLGDAARINFGSEEQRLAAAAQLGRDIQGMNIPFFNTPEYKAEFINEAGQRLQKAQENINKPTTTEFPAPRQPSGAEIYGVQGAPLQTTLERSGTLTGQGAQDLDWRTVSPTGEVNVTPARRTTAPTPLQKIGRGAKEIGGMFLDVLNVPAKGVERFLGRVQAVTTPLTRPVPLPDGTVYQPTVEFTPAPGPHPGVPPRGGQTVQQVVLEKYGDTPASQEALRQIERIAYSGPEAALTAAARMLTFGQTPEAALYGDGEYVQNVLMDKGFADNPQAAIAADPAAKFWFDRRVAELTEKGLTVEEAQKKAVDQLMTAGLPGEQNIIMEIAGQVLADPLNLVPSVADDILREMRQAEVVRNFVAPAVDSVDEVVAAARAELAPTVKLFGKPVRADWLPWVRTPTSVVDRYAEMGQDAVSTLLAQVKATEGAQLDNVLKALTDMAEPKPAAAVGGQPELFAARLSAWENRQRLATQVLSQFTVANSRAGKLGAALVRELLVDSSGNVTGKALKDLFASGKPEDVAAQLFSKLEDAKLNLFLPERQGAKTVKEFVERTGRKPSEFPVLERFIRGAQERVKLGKGAAAAGLDFPVSPGTYALATWGNFQNAVNSGLWKVFAEVNPAYSARNFFNNLTTALVDGTFTLENKANIDAFLDIIGNPLAASRGIGSGGAFAGKVGGGGFAGGLRLLGVPVGAQAVEQAFSRRIVYKAAKDALDRMLTIGRAIPDLPPGVAQAIGDDVARGLVNQIARTYGDTGAAIRWLKGQKGVLETWRILGDLDYADLRALDESLANKVDDLLKKAQTPQEFQAGLNRLRGQQGVKVAKAAAATPRIVQPDSLEYSVLQAESARLAPGDDFDSFSDMVAHAQEERAAAQARAFQSVQALADNGQLPAEAVTNLEYTLRSIADAGAQTAADTKTLREATWAEYQKTLSAPIEQNAKKALNDELWQKYFAERDRLWREYHETALMLWDDLASQPVAAAPVPPRPAAAQVLEAEAGAVEGQLANLESERASNVMGRWEGLNEIKRRFFPAEPGGYRSKVVWLDRSTGDWLPYNARRPAGRVWIKVPAAEVTGWGDQVVEAARELDIPVESIDDVIRMLDNELGINRRIRQLDADIRGLRARLRELRDLAKTETSRVGPVHQELAAVEGRLKAANLRLSAANRLAGATNVPPLPALVEQPGLMGAGQTLGTGFGAEAPKLPPDMASILNRIEQNAIQNWGQTRPLNLSPDQWRSLQAWAELAQTRANEAKTIAGQVGVEARNFALLNYSDKTNLDMWLSVVFPYHYWYKGTYANWLKRAVLNPAALATYGRYRQALNTLHAGLPEYWRQQLTTEDLGISMDNPLMFNLEATLSPLYGIMGSDFSDPNRRRAKLFGLDGVGAFAEDAAQFGPSLWAPIIWAMAASTARDDPQAAGAWLNSYLGQPTRVIRGVTAMAREALPGLGIPSGGVNLDPQIFINNLLTDERSGMTTWERNRVANAVFKLWDNPPAGMNLEDWRAQIQDQFLAQKGPLWDQAKQDMFASTGPAVLASFILGVGFKGRGQEELEFQAILDELANVRGHYGEWDAEQIQLAYADIRERHPMYDVLMLARADGPERDNKTLWDAVGRTGLDNYGLWAEAGVSQAALDAFYQNKTVETLPEELRNELVQGALAINARLRPKTIEDQRAIIAARAAKTELNAQLAREFGADTLALEREFFDIRDKNVDQAQAFLDNLAPDEKARLEGMWQARRASEVNNPQLAAYADVEMYQDYAKSQFYTEARREFGENIQEVNDAWKQIREARGQGAAAAFLAEHPELKKFWDAQSKFYDTELPQQTKDWLAALPEVPDLELREDRRAVGALQERIDEYVGEQAGRYQMPPGEEGAAPTSLAESFLAGYDAELAARDANTSYFDQKPEGVSLSGRDTYELTLNDHFQGTPEFRDNPELAQQAFEQKTGTWDQVTPNSNFGAYLGDYSDIRQALLYDETGRWQQVVAALRGMSEDQVDRSIPGLWPAWVQAQEWDAISEAARADIAGAKVTFNIDGTVSVTRQSAKSYFGDGATSGGGGAGAGGGGGTGGRGYETTTYRGRGGWPVGKDPNKYYGGEGPDIPGFPRRNIPPGGQYGIQRPPRVAHSWPDNSAARRLADLQELALSINPNLPVDQMTLEELMAWLAQFGPKEAQSVAPPGANGGRGNRFGPVLRVYRPRSGESGL